MASDTLGFKDPLNRFYQEGVFLLRVFKIYSKTKQSETNKKSPYLHHFYPGSNGDKGSFKTL